MPFRNGEVLKGGDPAVWEVINATDYDALNCSGAASMSLREDPIEPFLSDLFAWQETFRRLDPFEDWLVHLDLSSDEIRAISNQQGTQAGKLYDLFRAANRQHHDDPDAIWQRNGAHGRPLARPVRPEGPSRQRVFYLAPYAVVTRTFRRSDPTDPSGCSDPTAPTCTL